MTGASLIKQRPNDCEADAAGEEEVEEEEEEALLTIRGGPWAFMSVSLKSCSGIVVGMGARGKRLIMAVDNC